MVTVVPAASEVSNSMRPPCARAMSRALLVPRPVPKVARGGVLLEEAVAHRPGHHPLVVHRDMRAVAEGRAGSRAARVFEKNSAPPCHNTRRGI